jgi:hypothetical protein
MMSQTSCQNRLEVTARGAGWAAVIGAGGLVASAAADLSFTGTAGFGPGAGLNRYCETSSTSIINANASGSRFSKDGGPVELDPGESGITQSHTHHQRTGS